MWKLSEIRLKNIISFREAEYSFKQGVATLIFGRNEDNSSQPCNGSGKSSLVEAISFALIGEPLRKVKSIEDIINDHAQNAWVYLKLENSYDDTVFTIERRISRKASQIVVCHKYDGAANEIEPDKMRQATVSDYNKLILEELGLTKDELLNNYILCDNKYESFFDASDKAKKEIINRFSNGAIVDESIAKLEEDIAPLESAISESKTHLANISGSISAIESELENVGLKHSEATAERERHMAELSQSIVSCRDEIESIKQDIEQSTSRLDELNQVSFATDGLKNDNTPFIDQYNHLTKLIFTHKLLPITDFAQLAKENKESFAQHQESFARLKKSISSCTTRLDEAHEKYEKSKMAYQILSEEELQSIKEEESQKARIEEEIHQIDKELNKIDLIIEELREKQAKLDSTYMKLNVAIKGAVTCPKCHHEFLLDDKSSLEELKSQKDSCVVKKEEIASTLASYLEKATQLDDAADEKVDIIQGIDDTIALHQKNVDNQGQLLVLMRKEYEQLEDELSDLNRRQHMVENILQEKESRLKGLQLRMFNEFDMLLQAQINDTKQSIDNANSSISFAEGKIQQFRNAIEELKNVASEDLTISLKKSLKNYQSKYKEAAKELASLEKEVNELYTQKARFIQFKSYLANKKIDAFSGIVNDFLEKIGSDIRLRLEGFSVTRTGKLRDKISIQVMRDGIDCGSYYKFSGGEKARLNLACILSLHTLTNSDCEEGKGLDFIVIDELLDKSDEAGMAAYCEALNKLKQTSLLITQGAVAESYPYKLLIVKRQGVSEINN